MMGVIVRTVSSSIIERLVTDGSIPVETSMSGVGTGGGGGGIDRGPYVLPAKC
jgi:hypothetical protein